MLSWGTASRSLILLSEQTLAKARADYYFQAVGSGTGAIAAWEANMRLIEDGRFGSNIMKLMESPCRIASGSDDQHTVLVLGSARAEFGLYKFADWLPVRRMLKGSSAPVTYRSKGRRNNRPPGSWRRPCATAFRREQAHAPRR